METSEVPSTDKFDSTLRKSTALSQDKIESQVNKDIAKFNKDRHINISSLKNSSHNVNLVDKVQSVIVD